MADKKVKDAHVSVHTIARDLGIPVFSPSELTRHALLCAKVRKPLLVLGRPGVGKTELVAQWAKRLEMLLLVERFNGKDPTDLGLPYLRDDCFGYKRHDWSLPAWFLSEKEDTPEGYPGGMLFFGDEFAQAFPAMQNRTGEMLNERQLNRVPMSPKVWMVLAANFAQDKAATYPIPKQILDRCSVVVLASSGDDFRQYCADNDVHYHISGFSKWREDCLDAFDADAMISCTPRSLVSISPFLYEGVPYDARLSTFSSILGEGWGGEFAAYINSADDIPKLDEIIAYPDKTPIPDDDRTDILCATSAMLGRALSKANAKPLVRYLSRMSSEFCVFALRDAVRRDSDLKTSPAVKDWIIKYGDVLS